MLCCLSVLGQTLFPVSCQRAVLSLFPEKGDLAFLENWRPVDLLCADYKVLSRTLSSRLMDFNPIKLIVCLTGQSLTIFSCFEM